MEKYLEIGQIVNTFGIKGFVKVVPFTDDITRFENLNKVFILYDKQLVEFEIEEVKYNKNTVLLKFKGIEDINCAEKYKNCYLKIARCDAVKLPKNSYFIVDLIGIKVVTEQNEELGTLVDIFKTGSNDVYVVKDDFGKQILLPAIKSVIKKVDVENRIMIVNLIEGLV